MKRRTEDQHAGCRERDDRHKGIIDRYDAGVERLLKQHRPFAQDFDLQPGNSHQRVSFYCGTCSTAWPCRAFNELRALYGHAHEWEAATRPYEPLVLHLHPATPPDHDTAPSAEEVTDA